MYRLVSMAALVAAATAQCQPDQYFSPNHKMCKKAGASGAYCNVVQTCSSGFACIDNECTKSSCYTGRDNLIVGLGEACGFASCVPGLLCGPRRLGASSRVCEKNFVYNATAASLLSPGQASLLPTGDGNGEPVILEVSVVSATEPIMIPFNHISEETALEGVRTFMWGKKSPQQWEGRLGFQNSTILSNHLAIHALDYYVDAAAPFSISARVYGGLGQDSRNMMTALNWNVRELESTGFLEHPNDREGWVTPKPMSCVNGNIQADMEGEPDWEVWKAGWVDLIEPALNRDDIHTYHYGFDEENHQINYFECYSGAGAPGMETDAADVLARPVHASLGSWMERITFGTTNAATNSVFAQYGAYIPDDTLLANGPSAGYIINPNFIRYGL